MNEQVPRPGLSVSQNARRQRIMEAAVHLGLTGGYEAVQMRDVANRADVALGTVYRYFSSKDHLLASAFLVWLNNLEQILANEPSVAPTAQLRTKETMDRALRLTGKEPRLVEAVLASLASSDPDASKCQQQVSRSIQSIIASAIGREEFEDPDRRAKVVSHVWFSSLVGWINGWSDLQNVRAEIHNAVELVLPATRGGAGGYRSVASAPVDSVEFDDGGRSI